MYSTTYHTTPGGKCPARPPSASGAPAHSKPKKSAKPGVGALRGIRRLQKGTGYLISKARFRRVVREYAQGMKGEVRFSSVPLDALQTAAGDDLIKTFQKGRIAAIHTKRVTVQHKDLGLLEKFDNIKI